MTGSAIEQSDRHRDVPSEARPKYSSPLRLVAITALLIFLGEVAVMLLLAQLPPLPTMAEALLDGVLITLLIAPVLAFLLFRPMVLHIDRRELAEAKLRILNLELEDRIAERTAELTAANEHLSREIAERKGAEKGLLKSAEFIEKVLHSAPCILAIYDVNSMNCSFINESVRSLLGFSPDKALLQGEGFFKEIFSAGDFESFRSLNSAIAAGADGEILKCECSLRDADGEKHRFGIGLVVVFRSPENQPKDVLLAAVPTTGNWPIKDTG